MKKKSVDGGGSEARASSEPERSDVGQVTGTTRLEHIDFERLMKLKPASGIPFAKSDAHVSRLRRTILSDGLKVFPLVDEADEVVTGRHRVFALQDIYGDSKAKSSLARLFPKGVPIIRCGYKVSDDPLRGLIDAAIENSRRRKRSFGEMVEIISNLLAAGMKPRRSGRPAQDGDDVLIVRRAAEILGVGMTTARTVYDAALSKRDGVTPVSEKPTSSRALQRALKTVRKAVPEGKVAEAEGLLAALAALLGAEEGTK